MFKKEIISALKIAKYCFIIVDTSQDINKQEQKAISARYIEGEIEAREHTIIIKKGLVGFLNLTNYYGGKSPLWTVTRTWNCTGDLGDQGYN